MDGDFYVTPGGEIRQRGVRVDDGFHVSPDRLRAGARLYDSLSDDISAAERAGLLLDRPRTARVPSSQPRTGSRATGR